MRLVILFAVLVLGCSSAPSNPFLAAPPSVDIAEPLRGIADPGADPAVVLLDVGGDELCAGALLAADVVLTARRCVSLLDGDTACPAHGPQIADGRDLTTIRVLVGDDVATAVERARGRAVFVPEGRVLCGGDIAFLMLDATIDDIAPLAVQATGAALGDHVRSVTFGGGVKRVRDHVPVAAVSSLEMELAEAPCEGVAGGPAIEETTGEVVGVLSRSGPSCGASDGYDVDTRADVFPDLLASALSEGTMSHQDHQSKQKKGAVDVGANCTGGIQCAAGVCVDTSAGQYCTRSCNESDRCPTDYRCTNSQQNRMACVSD